MWIEGGTGKKNSRYCILNQIISTLTSKYMTQSSEPAAARLKLVLASEFQSLEEIVDKTEAFLQRYLNPLNEDFKYRILLLVSEAVTNAIKHGNKLDAGKKVRIDLTLNPEWLECCVEDEGNGFVRDVVKDPLRDENLLHDGGRGLFLLETMADTILYENAGRRIRIRCTL